LGDVDPDVMGDVFHFEYYASKFWRMVGERIESMKPEAVERIMRKDMTRGLRLCISHVYKTRSTSRALRNWENRVEE